MHTRSARFGLTLVLLTFTASSVQGQSIPKEQSKMRGHGAEASKRSRLPAADPATQTLLNNQRAALAELDSQYNRAFSGPVGGGMVAFGQPNRPAAMAGGKDNLRVAADLVERFAVQAVGGNDLNSQVAMAIRSPKDFREPTVIRSQNGYLSTKLVVGYSDSSTTQIYNPIKGIYNKLRLRTYNGQLTGPTLVAKPGDTLRITLENQLPPNQTEATDSFFHNLNSTNLHTHGLHVSPAGNSDNVLLQVDPGVSLEYEIKIPEDHPAGTFWYHSHKHGSVGIQTASGMAGALIIEGGLDEVRGIEESETKLFVFQQIPYIMHKDPTSLPPTPPLDADPDAIGQIEIVDAAASFSSGQPIANVGAGRFTTINGRPLPTLRVRPGSTQRWRFIHAGIKESILAHLYRWDEKATRPSIDLTKAAPKFLEIANDGLAFGKMVEQDTVTLQPGYRSDVLLKLDDPGIYMLIDDNTPSSQSITQGPELANMLAVVIVEGDRVPAIPLPTSESLAKLKPHPSLEQRDLTDPNDVIRASYRVETTGGKKTFTIDGTMYDPEAQPKKLILGHAQEWHLTANGNHPFHIHVNPFEVISVTNLSEDPVTKAPLTHLRAGKPVPADVDPNTGKKYIEGPIWKDTFLIPMNTEVVLRTRYNRYLGTFVQHCHILDHEDRGMMQAIEIILP